MKGIQNRRTFISKQLLGITTFALAAPAIIGSSKAAPISFKISSVEPNDPKIGFGRIYSDLLLKALKANNLQELVSLELYPDSQLGNELDVINQMKIGVVDMMVSVFTPWSNLVPELGVLDLGYLFDTLTHQTRALESPTGKAWLNRMMKKAGGNIMASGYFPSARNFNTTFGFSTPAELSGRKIRCINSPTMTSLISAMGAAATPMAFGEVFTALSSGVVDGLETTLNSVVGSKFYERAKFYVQTEHVFNPTTLVIGNAALAKLPANAREGFLDAMLKATIEERTYALSIADEALAMLRKNKVSILECDKEQFRQRTRPLIEAFLRKYPDAKPMIDAVDATRNA